MRILALLTVAVAAFGQTASQLEATKATLTDVEYRGKRSVKVLADANAANASSYAIVKGSSFHNGTLEVEVAGKPAPGAGEGARGFIGLAFRMKDGKYEYVYLRPTNGRADDQVRRNHATQYSSHPDYSFARLRKESPEKYESYVDLEPGVWTKYKLVVRGTSAQLFVHGAEQPCLIVGDLKLGDSEGPIALWVGPGTEGYFANLKVTAAP